MKKLFIISGSFFLIVLAFLAVYNLSFRYNNSDPVADKGRKAELEQQRASEEEVAPTSVVFQQIIPEDVFQPAAGENGIFYYSQRDNAIKEADYDGKHVMTHIADLPGMPVRIVWSPSRLGALLLIKSEGADRWYHADIRNKVVTALKKDVSRPAWTVLGDRIFYQYTDPVSADRTLNISFPDGSNWQKLTDLGKEDFYIATVPQSSLVSFWPKTDGNREGTLETISISGENRRTILTGRFGADYLWSPNGRRVLVQSTAKKGGNMLSIGIADENGGNYRNLLAPTLVSKVAWSKDGETFFYALPGSFADSVVLPNDYFSLPIHTADTFWKMNIRTGKKERLVPLDEMTETFDVSSIFLSPTETDLYFVERSSGKLYRITL
ncbi:MAG: hypothetical protein E6Q06_03615 [Candidatus Moraniibacteriota bacterium]|nr:MAG: hypothetical protein E6Q06_03615 [Candidatus Moranbacteria bacterium]